MGFIGGVFKKVGGFIKKHWKAIAIGVGIGALCFFTGGAALGVLGKGLGMISKAGGTVGKIFSQTASKLFSNPASMMARNNLGTLQQFTNAAQKTQDLVGIAQDVKNAWTPSRDPEFNQMSTQNFQNMMAYRQSQMYA